LEHCDDCGFVYAALSTAEIGDALRALGPDYRDRLSATPDADVRVRPAPDVWSALEYACHVRDVLVVQHQRLQLALVEDCPRFVSMGREERVVDLHYNEQAVDAVADDIDAAANELADAFAGLTDVQWERTGVYRWPTEAERTMAWLGRHTVHEGRHHLRDIDGMLVP
jgi:hypothetical protein